MTKFTNPYDGIDATGFGATGRARRLQTAVPVEDYDYIRYIRLTTSGVGTINTTINILIKKLIDELKRRNIKDRTDCDRFEHFVANCILTLPEDLASSGSPTSGSLPNSHGANERGSVASICPGASNASDITSNSKGQDVAKQRRQGVKRT